jgi:hypothetical protein
MPLCPEERNKRLQILDETIGQNLDEQIKEHKASAKVSLAYILIENLSQLKNVPKIEISRKHLSTASGQRC